MPSKSLKKVPKAVIARRSPWRPTKQSPSVLGKDEIASLPLVARNDARRVFQQPTNRVLLDAQGVNEKVRLLADAIAKEFGKKNASLSLVGIHTRGVPLAHRLAGLLEKSLGQRIPVGTLDITLYRDDVHTIADQPQVKETDLPFDLHDRPVVLVDDVLYTGRTIRSAMNALIDYGRPSCIRLAVLVDRGHRELPIRPDYVGVSIVTEREEVVEVRLKEVEGEDRVLIRRES